MSRIRTTIRLILVASMIIAALASSQAAAQRPGTSTTSNTDEGVHESELTGLEFTWTDDWELSGVDLNDEEEILHLESDLGIVFTGFGLYDDAEDARDDVLDGFLSSFDDVEVIDEDDSRGFAWSLIQTDPGANGSMFVYIEAEEDIEDDWDFITVVASGQNRFLDQYELVNDTVEMGGDALLGEFDVDEIEELIEGGAVADDDEMTPVADDENQSETGRVDEEGDATAGGNTYVFESDDIEIVTSGDVSIDESQSEDDSFEQVLLIGVGSIGAVSLLQSPANAEVTRDVFMAGFMDEMDDSRELDAGVDGGVAWGLYEATVSGMEMHVYASVSEDEFDGHFLQLIAAPANFFEDEFLHFQESVEINGNGMFDGVDIDDLLDIIDES